MRHMKNSNFLKVLAIILVLAQLACNYSTVSVFATPTASATPVTPSPTPLPPTETPTLAPPTNTLAPTATTGPAAVVNTPIPPTTKPTIAPTKAAVKPVSKGRFSGKFDGGTFTFRGNENGTYVTLKEITLTKAKCGSGKTASTHLTFEDISYFEIKEGSFSISFDRATVSGSFDTPTSAHGTIWIKINANKGVCEIGPLSWTASGSGT
jgi:hypothetical protein